jgi:hypothetical protein
MLDDCSDGGICANDDAPSLCGGERSEDESDWPAAPADMQTTARAGDTCLEGTHTGELSWWLQPALALRSHMHCLTALPEQHLPAGDAGTELHTWNHCPQPSRMVQPWHVDRT